MERTYRLEFNEKQQKFHLDNGSHEPDSNGWFTVFDHCSDNEFKAFKNYLIIRYCKPYTKEQVLTCGAEILMFTANLREDNLFITKGE